jgi:hypothetical protein
VANSLRQFFEARQLNENELGLIEFVVMSPAFETAFRPYLEGVRDNMLILWKDRSQKRKDEYPDDFLAGATCVIDDMFKFFSAVLADADFDRIHESMSHMTNERQYELKRQQGKISPVVGVDQQATPAAYDPLEDY